MKGEDSYKKGLWTQEEDRILQEYIQVHGRGRWNRIPKTTGLKRCGKSCRLRWMNYLSPTVKHGEFTEQEEDLIIRLHNLLGNRWALIAGRVPGRTDNQVKNHWNTHLSKRLGIKKEKRNTTKRPAAAASMSKPLDDNNNAGESGFTRRSQSPLGSGEVSEEHPPEVGRQDSVDSLWAANDIDEQSMEFGEGCFSLGEAFWQGL